MPLVSTLYGNGVLSVDASTATGAVGSAQYIDVALGRPVLEALPDICNAFKIRASSLLGTTGRPFYKLQTSLGVDLSMHMSFAQNGIADGQSIRLVNA